MQHASSAAGPSSSGVVGRIVPISPTSLAARVAAALDDVAFISEAAAVERLGRQLAARRDVHPEERLAYRRRRAQLLDEVAARTGNAEDRELAARAWTAVQALMAGVD